MLKHLDTQYKGQDISLECTHKKDFPPPQMYSSTAEDIDTLWRQGALNPNQYQMLQTWKEKCGLMVMGPRCLDCPLALKRNPRPGRPHVIETESWLDAKDRMYWAAMKKQKREPTVPLVDEVTDSPLEPVNAAAEKAVLGTVERGPVPGPRAGATPTPLSPLEIEDSEPKEPEADIPEKNASEEPVFEEETIVDLPIETPPKKDPSAAETRVDGPALGLDDDIISALADD